MKIEFEIKEEMQKNIHNIRNKMIRTSKTIQYRTYTIIYNI